MNSFKELLGKVKFKEDIDFDKVRTVNIAKEDIRGGSRLSLVATYDNGQRFEVYGEHSAPKSLKTSRVAHDDDAKVQAPITVVDNSHNDESHAAQVPATNEAVVSTGEPTAIVRNVEVKTTPIRTTSK